MSDPTLSNHLLILLGDGAATETFAFPCGANARSVKFTNNTGEEVTLDCDDPLNAMAAVRRWVESQDTEISISGRVSVESFEAYRAWSDGGSTKNIRVEINNTIVLAGGYYSLPAILQDFEVGAEGKSTMTFSATIVGAGQRIWTPAS